MSSINTSDQESPFEVVTPISTPKPRRAVKGSPKVTGDDNGNGIDQAEKMSLADGRLLIEMLSSVCENSSATKFNWVAISDKLGLPSAGATAKRAERLLKRFDLKVSDITGGARGRAVKTAKGDGTPTGKRKTVGDRDSPESPTKRQIRGKAILKKEQSLLQNEDDPESPKKVGTRTKLPVKAGKICKMEDNTEVEEDDSNA